MTFLFLQLSFLEFDVNVFKAILSIQRFFNLTEYREASYRKKIHCSLGMQECRFEFDNGFGNDYSIIEYWGVGMAWLDCNFHCLTI